MKKRFLLGDIKSRVLWDMCPLCVLLFLSRERITRRLVSLPLFHDTLSLHLSSATLHVLRSLALLGVSVGGLFVTLALLDGSASLYLSLMTPPLRFWYLGGDLRRLIDDSACVVLISRWLSSTAPRLSCSPRRLRISLALLDGSSRTPPRRFWSRGGSPRRFLDDSASALLISRWLSSTAPRWLRLNCLMISRWLSSTARRRRKAETSLSVALLGRIKMASVDDWSNRKVKLCLMILCHVFVFVWWLISIVFFSLCVEM